MAEHGYGPYTNGCRCVVCRQAKCDYMRARRTAARTRARVVKTLGDDLPKNLRWFMPIPGITHGRAGYDEHGCRCLECRGARFDADRARRDRRQRARAG